MQSYFTRMFWFSIKNWSCYTLAWKLALSEHYNRATTYSIDNFYLPRLEHDYGLNQEQVMDKMLALLREVV